MILECKGFKNESICELILIAARVDSDFFLSPCKSPSALNGLSYELVVYKE